MVAVRVARLKRAMTDGWGETGSKPITVMVHFTWTIHGGRAGGPPEAGHDGVWGC